MLKTMFFSIAVAAMVGLLFAPAPSSALSVRNLSLEEMVRYADEVVQVRYVSADYDTDPDSGQWIAYHTFQVIDVIKGSSQSGENMVVRQLAKAPADEEGNTYTHVAKYLPHYRVGKEYILFWDEGELAGAPVGLQQGVIAVEEVGGQKTVAGRSLANKLNATASRVGLATTGADADNDLQSLETFKGLLRQMAN